LCEWSTVHSCSIHGQETHQDRKPRGSRIIALVGELVPEMVSARPIPYCLTYNNVLLLLTIGKACFPKLKDDEGC
jgi:hypothetical protein